MMIVAINKTSCDRAPEQTLLPMFSNALAKAQEAKLAASPAVSCPNGSSHANHAAKNVEEAVSHANHAAKNVEEAVFAVSTTI